MNAPKVEAEGYIQFLVASTASVSGAEAARVHPTSTGLVTHDLFTHLLHRLEPGTATPCQEAQYLVGPDAGVLDDTTLNKPYACKMDLVTRHWSGKHLTVVQSCASTGHQPAHAAWSDGQRLVLRDYRLTDK